MKKFNNSPDLVAHVRANSETLDLVQLLNLFNQPKLVTQLFSLSDDENTTYALECCPTYIVYQLGKSLNPFGLYRLVKRTFKTSPEMDFCKHVLDQLKEDAKTLAVADMKRSAMLSTVMLEVTLEETDEGTKWVEQNKHFILALHWILGAGAARLVNRR